MDLVAVNKTDGQSQSAGESTARHYCSALKSRTLRSTGQEPKVFTCSALHDEGIETIWQEITSLHSQRVADGSLSQRRAKQNLHWLWAIVEHRLRDHVRSHPNVEKIRVGLEEQVLEGTLSAEAAARTLLEACGL